MQYMQAHKSNSLCKNTSYDVQIVKIIHPLYAQLAQLTL